MWNVVEKREMRINKVGKKRERRVWTRQVAKLPKTPGLPGSKKKTRRKGSKSREKKASQLDLETSTHKSGPPPSKGEPASSNA